MGRIKERRMGLRRRWLWNTAAVVASVGLVCALAVTVLFALTDYSNLHANLRLRAETAAEALNGVQNQEYEDFYQTCLDAVQSFSQRNTLEVQFVDPEGNVLSTSYGIPTTSALETPEIAEAVRTRGAQDYFGKDPETGKRILAVSAPIIYRNGEVIGVLRFVTATRRVCPAPESPAWPSTPFTPRASGAMWKASAPTPGNSWGKWTSRTWTPSTACPRPFPSTRKQHPRTPAPPWAR